MEPKITLVESWYWITIFLVVIIGAALQFFKEDDISDRAKRRINFWLFVFGFIGAVAALFDKCNDTRSQKQLSSNVDSVKNTSTKTKQVVDTTLTLSALTYKLSTQIESLNQTNNSIASNTQNLAADGKNLISKNVKLTNNLEGLIQEAKKNLRDIQDEQTGGKSIPLVAAYLFKDSKMVDELYEQKYMETQATGK